METLIHHFYPRSPCGERPKLTKGDFSLPKISIHALLAESDIVVDFMPLSVMFISIHALLAESDACNGNWPFAGLIFLSTLSLRRATRFVTKPCKLQINFYPRSPCGERRFFDFVILADAIFLSTLSLRRATPLQVLVSHVVVISIHALLAESDVQGRVCGVMQ